MARTRIDVEAERERLERAGTRDTVSVRLSGRRAAPVVGTSSVRVDWGNGEWVAASNPELAALVVAWLRRQVVVAWPFVPAIGAGVRRDATGAPLLSRDVRRIVAEMVRVTA